MFQILLRNINLYFMEIDKDSNQNVAAAVKTSSSSNV